MMNVTWTYFSTALTQNNIKKHTILSPRILILIHKFIGSVEECGLNRGGCLYNGECQDGDDSYTCKCVSGFSGRHCQTTRDLCSGMPCSNGGCINNYANATYKCFCDYPYQLGK